MVELLAEPGVPSVVSSRTGAGSARACPVRAWRRARTSSCGSPCDGPARRPSPFATWGFGA
eukprot:13793849-Alexandrium_andersonii.AAC.1